VRIMLCKVCKLKPEDDINYVPECERPEGCYLEEELTEDDRRPDPETTEET